jgi:hypothetical protein
VNDTIKLSKGECVISDEHNINFKTDTGAEVVLFVTNKEKNCFKQGMFSGNKM